MRQATPDDHRPSAARPRRAATPTLIAAAALACLALIAGPVLSAAVEPDGDLMRSIDDTTKGLDSSVSQHDLAAATQQAQELAAVFSQISEHYAAQPDHADAVDFSRKTRQFAEQALQSLKSGDFDAASGHVLNLTRSCKACHQVYKKD